MELQFYTLCFEQNERKRKNGKQKMDKGKGERIKTARQEAERWDKETLE